jgi:hypothetical protein
VDQHSRLFIGLDVSKLKISVAVADGERGGEVRFFGHIPSDPASVSSLEHKLAKRGAKLHFCYEAGPESSTGEHVKRGGITKAGNSRARRMLVEGAWAYRFPARVSRTKQAQLDGLPRTVREIPWKGQLRLCSRDRTMILAGKHKVIAITAIAREMAAFL